MNVDRDLLGTRENRWLPHIWVVPIQRNDGFLRFEPVAPDLPPTKDIHSQGDRGGPAEVTLVATMLEALHRPPRWCRT